jgi:membrane protease YdiL (CAAX protease family)
MVIAAVTLAGQSGEVAGTADASGSAGGRPITLLALAAITLVSLAIAWRRGWLAMPAAEASPSPRPNPGPSLVVLAMAIPLLGAIGAMIARHAFALPESPDLADQVRMLAGASVAQLPAVVAILLLSPRARSGRVLAALLGILGCAIAFPAVQTIAAVAGWIQQLVSGIPAPAVAHRTLEGLVSSDDAAARLCMLVLVVVVIPPIEEIAYRGGFQGGLRRLGWAPWPATIATSLLFAFMHVGAIPETGLAAALSGLFALSIGLGILRERTGSLVAPAVAHALFNLVNVIVARG